MVCVRKAVALLPQGLVDGSGLVPGIGAVPHPDVRIGAAFDAAARAAVVEPLAAKYGLAPHVRRTLSDTGLLGVLVGMACLERAGAIDAKGEWKLPHEDRDDVGVIFASSFAHHEGAMRDVAARARHDQLSRLRSRIAACNMDGATAAAVAEVLRGEDDEEQAAGRSDAESGGSGRRMALQITLDVHSQLAQLVGARGPATYVSNACASTTAAIQVAINSLRAGEAKCMLVVGSDAVLSGAHVAPIVSSFVRLGAASTAADAADAVLPFSKRRDGFVLGEGAVALLLERHEEGADAPSLPPRVSGAGRDRDAPPCVSIAASRIANSAHHGTALDGEHIAATLRRCVDDARGEMPLSVFAACALYVSHETCTRSCAQHEVAALRAVFGAAATCVRITNTKCYTGHAMGACVEDVAAVAALEAQRAPRVTLGELDDAFDDLAFCDGTSEARDLRFAIHVALGMGSHVAVVIYKLTDWKGSGGASGSGEERAREQVAPDCRVVPFPGEQLDGRDRRAVHEPPPEGRVE